MAETRISEPLKPSHPGLKYRPDIDGLRAIAVLPVIAFHLHFDRTPGGYVGVDIFFVISGYLISAILLRDLQASRFSIAGFYERRIRRILPALFAVVLATTVLAYFYLLPADFEDYAKSIIATALSSSNFYFFTQAGYFVGGGPLLHTWSLAVEEQFYIIFPLLLMCLYRYKRAWLKWGLLLVAILSLVLSSLFEVKFPTANFYMPYTRAWELLVGVLLSIRLFPKINRRFLREVLAVVGIILILFPIFTYSATTTFPGLAALPPCIGTAFVIAAGEAGKTVIGNILSLGIFTFIGRISYSLYLWHWPLLFFNSSGFLIFNSLSHRGNVAVYLVVCFTLAYLSWRFIEQPFRFGRLRVPRRSLFLTTAGIIVAFVTVGFSIVALHGMSYRYPPAALAIARWSGEDQDLQYHNFGVGTCFIVFPDSVDHYKADTCLHQEAGKKNYLLLGDSHAAALSHALQTQLDGVHILQATTSNCKPFPGQGSRTGCGQLMNYIYDQYLQTHKVDALLLTARWKDRDLPQIASVADWGKARRIPVVIIGPAEEYDTPLPILMAYAIKKHDSGLPYRHRLTNIEALDKRMKEEAAKDWHVPYISLIDSVCAPGSCHEYVDAKSTVPILFDHDHYTDEGSTFLVGKLVTEGAFSFAVGQALPLSKDTKQSREN
jgi:peptidoglycan/LPS O-acetylase OafA/YrhL